MSGVRDLLAKHVTLNIAKVREEAGQHNGGCTWEFSQTLDPVRSFIHRNEKSAGGICEILAAKWICEDARGSSLESWSNSGGSLDMAFDFEIGPAIANAVSHGDAASLLISEAGIDKAYPRGGAGTFQRRGPTGGAAKGMPRNIRRRTASWHPTRRRTSGG